jgi:hypothetical protein
MSHGAFSTRKQAAETNVLAAIFFYKYFLSSSHLYLIHSFHHLIIFYPPTHTHPHTTHLHIPPQYTTNTNSIHLQPSLIININ